MEMTCWLCDIRPVESPIKPLCKGCYRFCHKRNLLHIFPSFNNNDKKIARAVKKYGESVKDDMKLLEAGETTLAAVGEKNGISREMVRNLFPVFFGKPYSDVKPIKREVNAKKKCAKLRERKTIESKFKRYKKNSRTYTGLVAENLFNQKCLALGYDVDMHGGVIDATVNGLLVEVKSATSSFKTRGSKIQRYYHFPTRAEQIAKADYYACLMFDVDTWYIVPRSLLKIHKGGDSSIQIPKHDVEYGSHHKYKDMQQYREAWHLLAGVPSDK